MKKIIILLLALFLHLPLFASDIVQVEYFIDADPGFGNGVNIPIIPIRY